MNPKTAFTFVAAILLTPQPAQADPKADFQLFASGKKLTFDSTGHEKANGIRIKLSYPKTWKASEGERPHIIQKLESEGGRGVDNFMLQIRPLPPEYNHDLTADDKKLLTSKTFLMRYIPKNVKLIEYKQTMIDGEPCGMFAILATTEVAGTQLVIYSILYFIPIKGFFVMLNAGSCGKADEGVDAITSHYRDVKPVFQQIAASCILLDKWAK